MGPIGDVWQLQGAPPALGSTVPGSSVPSNLVPGSTTLGSPVLSRHLSGRYRRYHREDGQGWLRLRARTLGPLGRRHGRLRSRRRGLPRC